MGAVSSGTTMRPQAPGVAMDLSLHDDLTGQVALVTGANRGIGGEIARQLAELGATVHAGHREADALEGVAEASEGRILPVRLDVTDEASIDAAVASVVEHSGRLDILVNNAGIGDWHGTTLETLATDRLDAVLATNLRGPMLVCRAALPHLLEQDGPRIVNVSSGMGALGEGMSGSAPAYRVTKTGLNGLTAYLHSEYGPRGLIANSVCPGWVRTDMGGHNAPRAPEKGAETPVWLARFAPGAPGGRFWRDRHVIDW